jgi:hypothetical protein
VTDVLELDTFDESGLNGLGFMETFEGLHARLLVRAHHVYALCREVRSVTVRVTDVLDVSLVLLRVVTLVLRG